MPVQVKKSRPISFIVYRKKQQHQQQFIAITMAMCMRASICVCVPTGQSRKKLKELSIGARKKSQTFSLCAFFFCFILFMCVQHYTLQIRWNNQCDHQQNDRMHGCICPTNQKKQEEGRMNE